MFFKYRVKDQKSRSLIGTVEARSIKDAAKVLRDQNFLIIDIKPIIDSPLNVFKYTFDRVGFSEIVNFTRQLATMVAAGLTLTEALSILGQQSKHKAMLNMVDDILNEIEAGNNFASALEKYPQYFSRIYISSIKAGEAAGMIDRVLNRLADNLEKEREFRGKIKGAMVYPVIIIIGMIGVFFIMMTMVIPKMTGLYKDFNVDLPWTTLLLMAVSDFFVNFWWLIIIGTIGAVIGFIYGSKTKVGEKLLDSFTLNLPLIGPLKRETMMVEFTRTLGLLVGAGLPILEALNIVSNSMESVTYRKALKDAASEVEKGFPLGIPLGQNPDFPPIVSQMTKVGEETGKLDEALLKLSSYFEFQTDQTVKGLTTAIEPIIMVVLGVGVGFLIFAIIMPIYQLTSAF
ncbi:MAG: type II secretion system F family protein [Candidatus Gottesmanbacteria bacterium]